MKLQTDLQSQQQNHRLSRAAWLQARWLEISEQEHWAQLHNQKLMLDFQRAQDTLDDMVARTEAMNTIRVQYERYLKENFPRWQQKLKDTHVSEHSKQIEEDQDIKADISSHPVISKSPYQSQFPSQTHQIGKEIRQNAAKCKQDHLYLPATWLTDPQPLISGLQQSNIPKDHKNLHNIKALNHLFTFSSPSDSHHQSHSPVQQKPPSIDHTWQNPWVGVRQGLTGHFTPAGASWPRLPVINPVPWGMMDVPDSGGEKIQCSETDQENPTKEMLNPPKESKQRLKHKRRGGECDQPPELDGRPVHLLKDHKASEDSSVSFEALKVSGCGIKQRRKKRRDGTQSHLAANEQESQCSSTLSQDALLSAPGGHTDPKRSVNHLKPSAGAKMDTSKESINTGTDIDGVIQDEEEKEESSSQEKPVSHPSSDKTDGTEVLNQKHSTEEEDTDECANDDLILEEKISADESEEEEGSEDEEEPGLDEAQGSEEEGSERVVRSREDLSDEEEREKEGDISSNIPDSDSEEGGEKTQEEIEENSSQDQNESEEEESDKIVHVQIHNSSLKELQAADETEEEEVYNQEIEDDDDEDDETKQAYLWSKYPLNNQTKYHDDDDDDDEDIENVLKPQVNSQIHREDDVEETKQTNGPNDSVCFCTDLLSDSSEEDTPKKTKNEPADSDDEFDHFYD
ncbi:uncharacterized protein [Paramisgurnus dabryanus]|uniref:uncharacterized protein n=1 Tax=Paramisgurnus dabryanus TaxID=90735 RepID=UPI003CCFD610